MKTRLSKDILICTVGTSLFTNIDRLEPTDPLKIEKEKRNWVGLTNELLKKSCDDKVCGAEINSITSLVKKGYLDKRHKLYLLVSDTDKGKETGEVLKRYYEDSKNPCYFDRVIFKEIENLTDKDVKSFRNKGLKNLVKEIVNIVKEKGSERIIINATGGYKAQIAFAGLIGQTLEIPVMYMFETFPEIISLPPQPLSFNFDFWFKYYEELERLYIEKDALVKDVDSSLLSDERISVLIERKEINKEEYVSLSSMGFLFHEGFKYRYRKDKKAFIPADLNEEEREEPVFTEHFYHHFSPSAEEFVTKIWREKKYIKRIKDFYINPNLAEKNSFKIDEHREKIVFTFNDGTKTAKFNIEIFEPTHEKLKWVLIDLNETYM